MYTCGEGTKKIQLRDLLGGPEIRAANTNTQSEAKLDVLVRAWTQYIKENPNTRIEKIRSGNSNQWYLVAHYGDHRIMLRERRDATGTSPKVGQTPDIDIIAGGLDCFIDDIRFCKLRRYDISTPEIQELRNLLIQELDK